MLSLTLSGQQQGGGRMSSDAAQQQLLPPSTSLSAAASSASFLPDYLLDADYVFGQNIAEHNPAPLPSGHPLLSGPPTPDLKRCSPDSHVPFLFHPPTSAASAARWAARMAVPRLRVGGAKGG